MNDIKLEGIIRNIRPSHQIGNAQYNKADLIVSRQNDIEDLLTIKFKDYENIYKDGDKITLTGNVRTHNNIIDGSNKLEVYVFTHFDNQVNEILTNEVNIDGRICKIKPLKINSDGTRLLEFILANNIFVNNKKINNYIPCIAWNNEAEKLASLQVSDKLIIKGKLQSHIYKKYNTDSDYEYKVAHQLLITNHEVVE